ncbi:putative 20S rRNA accumulation protein 4 [Daldinia childiae]|uniref:putative 20S rRNA accumulation protein 4 n=1 Tax=Daldinia childiae TaxID=326645 RepID=UPI0014458FFF|nr:putative 20S rRNA accumulation protein 4 [Daldinia childiae]KAF3059195.1 putative 20S rRNA accumulation protein 4 [Daldinia childiae]
MAPYDSDSSAGEEDEFTETNVLLGYASRDAGDDFISRLGGRPEWLDSNNAPSAALARCKICKDLMVLLLQLDGELPIRFPGHERRLYVFSCRRKTCRRKEGSIRALRSVRIAPGSATAAATATTKEEKTKPKEEKPKSQPPSNLGETLFGAQALGSPFGSTNPFSTSTTSSAGGNPFATSENPFSTPSSPPPSTETKPEPKPESSAPSINTPTDDIKSLPRTFAQTLNLNNNQQTPSPPPPSEPWPIEADQPTPYPIAYLSEAEYETLDPTPAPSIPQNTRLVDVDDNDGKKGGKEDREVFESSMDAAFQRFADRLAQNPEQAIRYEFGGQPLLYSKTDAVGKLFATPGTGVVTTAANGMPRCGNCGAARTFEVQMTPHAITELEADELSLEGMDWGTVIVGVCEKDCQARGVSEGEVGYLEEWAGVQWEELTATGAKR